MSSPGAVDTTRPVKDLESALEPGAVLPPLPTKHGGVAISLEDVSYSVKD